MLPGQAPNGRTQEITEQMNVSAQGLLNSRVQRLVRAPGRNGDLV
jgi:hypothetical protein